MTQEASWRRKLRKQSSNIRQHLFPLFQGHQDRLQKIGFHPDEFTDHGLLMGWLRKTHDNLEKVCKYINKSYANTYRFMKHYHQPSVIMREHYPYQTFIRRHHQKPPLQQDGYVNKKNADMVRYIMNTLKNELHDAIINPSTIKRKHHHQPKQSNTTILPLVEEHVLMTSNIKRKKTTYYY